MKLAAVQSPRVQRNNGWLLPWVTLAVLLFVSFVVDAAGVGVRGLLPIGGMNPKKNYNNKKYRNMRRYRPYYGYRYCRRYCRGDSDDWSRRKRKACRRSGCYF